MTSRFLHSLSVQGQGHMWLVQAGANSAAALTQSREAAKTRRLIDLLALCAFESLSLGVEKLWLQGRPTNCVEDPRGDATEGHL
jgi:hypothetical protein